jgi:hypothetical protein
MSRDIVTDVQVALESGEFAPHYLVEMNFHNPTADAAAPIRLWTGVGDLSHSGNTYTGAGDLMVISDLEEAAELKASGMTISLSGVNDSALLPALSYEYTGRSCKVFLMINKNTSLIEVFSGFMDTMTIEDSSESSQITLTVENKLVDLDRTNPFRYTQESHSLLYSGDTFFSYVQDLQDQEVQFGPTR